MDIFTQIGAPYPVRALRSYHKIYPFKPFNVVQSITGPANRACYANFLLARPMYVPNLFILLMIICPFDVNLHEYMLKPPQFLLPLIQIILV